MLLFYKGARTDFVQRPAAVKIKKRKEIKQKIEGIINTRKD